ncbi:MAG TPA: alkaline phosphatase PhoX [Bdellovibrionales bacterium]|nr:alkaline phosphatase PhoX [Bdellovibrionales bacterium]
MVQLTRRRFLEFMGRGTLGLAALPAWTSCVTGERRGAGHSLPFEPIAPTTADELVLAKGFTYQPVIARGEPINAVGDAFGCNNDYLALFPLKDKTGEAVLWVNHEFPESILNGIRKRGEPPSRAQLEAEMHTVGGSLLHVQKTEGRWSFVPNSKYNRRLSGHTPIPFAGGVEVSGSKTAIGTFANCAGGVTPWGTVLTCEENSDFFYGEVELGADGRREVRPVKAGFGWERHTRRPPEHYGWVVEVDPFTGAAKKHTSLGRFAHECATVWAGQDGRCAVYTGDDMAGGCLYKLITKKAGDLTEGVLYTADLANGRWIPLDLKLNSSLQNKFKTQLDVLIHARAAARLAGGTPLDRPEDIEIDPQSKAVLVTQTMNQARGNNFGSITKIAEKNNDPFALEFTATTFLAGGAETGLACPDNLAFDRNGNLWITSDMAAPDLNTGAYEPFGNNGLFYVPMSGPDAGRCFRVGSAPVRAEFTGPFFAEDGTLFVSIQHPGEGSLSFDKPLSKWKSSVVTISGPALERLLKPKA